MRSSIGQLLLGGLMPCLTVLFAACGGGSRPVPEKGADTATPGGGPAAKTAESGLFVEAGAASGLEFTHWNGMSGEYRYPEMMGSGVALFDYDNDGDLDVYLVQGNPLGESEAGWIFPPPGELPLTDRLFRNDLKVTPEGRELRLSDVTEESGIVSSGYGMGVVAADFDNDGQVDLYVTRLGGDQLFRNNGDGTFLDATESSGTGERRWGVSAAVIDFDRDGWLDLYVGHYVEWSLATDPRCTDELGLPNYCGPLAFKPQPDTLYRNLATPELAFEDASVRAGIRDEMSGALGVVSADFDDDGWPDLYVGNDGLPNQLWINRGDGTFEDRALLSGTAVNGSGQPEASMGIAAADFDGDGDEDLFLSHLDQETNTVYVNDGRALFEDRSVETGLGSPSFSSTGFGTAFFDYDNDGWLDLMVVNGAVKVRKSLALAGDPLPLRQRNQLFLNRGDGTFEETTERAGAAFLSSEVSRGAAFGDLDNDGDVDVVIANNSGPAKLLLNQVGEKRHWLGLRLVTRVAGGAERDAWGARLSATLADGRELVRRVGANASYASASDPRLLLGLGEATSVPSVRVRWVDGSEEQWNDLAIDRYETLRQGEGEAVSGGGS